MSELEKKMVETEFKFLHGLNPELLELEIKGFLRGKRRGKTMKVSIDDIYLSLEKQIIDLKLVWHEYIRSRLKGKQKLVRPNKYLLNIIPMKKCLADIRNVAGCMFLKLQELEKSK